MPETGADFFLRIEVFWLNRAAILYPGHRASRKSTPLSVAFSLNSHFMNFMILSGFSEVCALSPLYLSLGRLPLTTAVGGLPDATRSNALASPRDVRREKARRDYRLPPDHRTYT